VAITLPVYDKPALKQGSEASFQAAPALPWGQCSETIFLGRVLVKPTSGAAAKALWLCGVRICKGLRKQEH